jgi:CubicO group peptidase (beta-lactamase class C family)
MFRRFLNLKVKAQSKLRCREIRFPRSLPPQYKAVFYSFSKKNHAMLMPFHNKFTAFFALIFLLKLCPINAQTPLYFPPTTGTTWETTTPQSLGWCTNKIDSLYAFLGSRDTKAFIVLKDGRIVLEKYYGTFTQDSVWYWASAGKTLTAFLAGIAQQDKLININDSTSKYVGVGWTSLPSAKERLITLKNNLTMTTGLDDAVPDADCTLPSCFVYKADAGTRWAYHNAAYYMVQNVIEKVSGITINQYTNQKLLLKTGITGLWVNNIFFSKPRSMARFGLLLLNKGKWNQDIILSDTAYLRTMTNTSQNLNKSYGYLTWLNGKGSFMLPGSQIVSPTNLVPSAPADMFCALGKNDQKIYVVTSQNLVVIRMGEKAGNLSLNALSNFDNEIWQRLTTLACTATSTTENTNNQLFTLYPNPTSDFLHLNFTKSINDFNAQIMDINGRILKQFNNQKTMPINDLPTGFYALKVVDTEGVALGIQRFVKH